MRIRERYELARELRARYELAEQGRVRRALGCLLPGHRLRTQARGQGAQGPAAKVAGERGEAASAPLWAGVPARLEGRLGSCGLPLRACRPSCPIS